MPSSCALKSARNSLHRRVRQTIYNTIQHSSLEGATIFGRARFLPSIYPYLDAPRARRRPKRAPDRQVVEFLSRCIQRLSTRQPVLSVRKNVSMTQRALSWLMIVTCLARISTSASRAIRFGVCTRSIVCRPRNADLRTSGAGAEVPSTISDCVSGQEQCIALNFTGLRIRRRHSRIW